jgi:hypothetical protein
LKIESLEYNQENLRPLFSLSKPQGPYRANYEEKPLFGPIAMSHGQHPTGGKF